jgi:lysozyme
MDLVDQLKRDEGYKLMPYKDSLGFLTIGAGRCIEKVGISESEAEFLLENDIANVQRELAPFAWYQSLDMVRKAAIENMAFNLGIAGLLHFPSMIAALGAQDWQKAHDEALNSVWASQVGARANRIAQQILTGQWV